MTDQSAPPTTPQSPPVKKRSVILTYRLASVADCTLLAAMNHALIRDEKHRNSMAVAELAERMRGWLAGLEYSAVIFERDSHPVAYALYRIELDGSVYLRQFFVSSEYRRRGIGTASFKLLTRHIFPPGIRIGLDVLAENQTARSFWATLGFRSYSIAMERA